MVKTAHTEVVIRRSVVLLLGILLLGAVDVVVLERIYKPLAQTWHIPWRTFLAPLPFLGPDSPVLWWHVAFVPLGLVLFALTGLAGRDMRLAGAGWVLFGTGWEDAAYYLLQWRLPPAELPWLDFSPGIAWTRWVTGTPHVTRIGLAMAVAAGGLAGAWLVELLRTSKGSGAPVGR